MTYDNNFIDRSSVSKFETVEFRNFRFYYLRQNFHSSKNIYCVIVWHKTTFFLDEYLERRPFRFIARIYVHIKLQFQSLDDVRSNLRILSSSECIRQPICRFRDRS